MPLDIVTLKSDIATMLDELETFDGSAGKTNVDSKIFLKNSIASAIEKYVKSGDVVGVNTSVTVTNVSGVTVGAQTSGPGTGSGAQTGTGNIV